ncbi:MAG: hypothetical protein PQJ49_11180 [Sphaerochaetaceae bacterium]|nr:hypothetical protein [Sphaerochaetaceae bacterium]
MFKNLKELKEAKGLFLINRNDVEMRKYLEYIYSKSIEPFPLDYSYLEVVKKTCNKASVPNQITRAFIKEYFMGKGTNHTRLEGTNLFLLKIYKIDILKLLKETEFEYSNYKDQVLLPYFQRREKWILQHQEKLKGA